MNTMNNLKQIRELYGATQEQIAQALSVNRVTVANWENGSSVASSANQEKMSMYYGIGPEFFYEQELSEEAKQQIIRTSERERDLVSQSDGRKNKQDDFQRMFESISFDSVLKSYMMTMKLLMAKADDANLDKLRLALTINQKMGKRLAAIVHVREEEESSGDPPIADLISQALM